VTAPGWSHIPATYDVVAAEYAAKFSDELADKPFDRELLDGLAREVAGRGLVCDLGCGPGHLAAYLAQRGCDVVGIDISPEMLLHARERHGDVRFQLGDMRAIPLANASCVAIACFYALIHIPRDEVPVALAEFHRVLVPGGVLVLAVHGGAGELHTDGWFGHPVSVDATLFGAAELTSLLTAAGFVGCVATERNPYPSEAQTSRLYVRATRAQSRR
jgi:SAM-dependent methyltransferase